VNAEAVKDGGGTRGLHATGLFMATLKRENSREAAVGECYKMCLVVGLFLARGAHALRR
jgi:hypothetical protein